nr:thiol peroxidase, Bcp-type [uncultured bacterium]
MLEIGDVSPDFSGIDENGKKVSSKNLLGQKFILFFYPKDMTPGCTIEACNLRDNYKDLKKKGFEIFGVSADAEKRHQKFIEKFELPFSLLADTEKTIINAFGVWGKKKFMGREFDGIRRTTFGIDEFGKILFIIDKVKTKNHTSQILEALEN